MTPLIEKKIDNKKYAVFYDEDGFYVDFYSNQCMKFENKSKKDDYMKKFINDELYHYIVERLTKCNCCNQWKTEDSVGGIVADNAENALNFYLSDEVENT